MVRRKDRETVRFEITLTFLTLCASIYAMTRTSNELKTYLTDTERRFQEEVERIRAERPAPPAYEETTLVAAWDLSPRQKGWLYGGAIAVASLVAAVGYGHTTIPDGIRAIFHDDQPPITHPVDGVVDNYR